MIKLDMKPQIQRLTYWRLERARDTVNAIGRRRQQISEDDFQLNPQELWS